MNRPSDKRAYIFFGEICSGKTQILKEVCALTGAGRFSTSTVIETDLQMLGISVNRDTMQTHGNTDPERWATELVQMAYGSEGQTVCLESMRYPAQIEIVQRAFPRNLVIGVKAPEELRFEWILKRGRKGDPKTLEELQEVDRRDRTGYLQGNGQNLDGCFEVLEELIQRGGGLIITNDQPGREYLQRYAREIVDAFKRRVYG